MGYVMERNANGSHIVYILYTEKMGYLATMSRHNGRLRYEYISVPEFDVPASTFTEHADLMDREALQ